ncbi:hypothetical protein GF325_17205 [Candidatus Bathyarchaeota archaeon]|nr:hypothetical protein [Candidatus Bathyarchaeota archaeon]
MTRGDKKITYIGAGSFRFSIGLFRNIVAAEDLFPYEVCLHDIDPKSLDIMTRILKRMVRKSGASVKITATLDRREALENADFLYKSISVGMQASEWYDIHVPQKLGIPQNTGDTCGPGGIFRALRCIPSVVDIATDMKELCPNAVLLNYTNPQAALVMAARRVDPGLQYVGLCHELFGGMKTVRKALNVAGIEVDAWSDLDISYGGVNHFTWLKTLELDGKDLYPVLRDHGEAFIKHRKVPREFNWFLMGKHGYFPIPGSRHVAEFMPQYYNFFNHESKPFGITPLRQVSLLDKARRLAYWFFRRMAGWFWVPGPSKKGEKALDMTMDWLESNPVEHVVNVPNKQYIPNLPENAIVEVPGMFKDGKMVGTKVGDLPGKIADFVRVHAEQQFLTVDAAMAGDPDAIVKAMLHDPMNRFVEDEQRIEDLTFNMLHYEQEWLPGSWKEFIPTIEELKERKYHVLPEELAGKKTARRNKYPLPESLKEKAWLPPS